MADLNDYWKQVTSAESFQDLDDSEKEKVRNHLFEKYVQSSNSYIQLPQSQRLAVKKHYDEVTHIEPETLLQKGEKEVKKISKEVKPAIESVKGAYKNVKESLSDPYTQSNIEALEPGGEYTVEIPGMKKVSEGISKAGSAVGEAIEPSEQEMISHAQKGSELTQFDKARLYASGGVQTVSDFVAGLIPQTNVDASVWGLSDIILKAAGSTFLGAERHLPGWKPKTGLSSEANNIGDALEKAITSKRLDMELRKQTMAGPPKPLEVLANKEAELKSQAELDTYKQWLEQVDKLSPSGGEPEGDLYPEAKVNVSQLRDMAQERLDKLQKEPVRVESLSKAEDDLQGYYRRRIDNQRVWMQPGGAQPEPQPALAPGPSPAGLLKPGETPEASPPEQAPAAAPKAPAKPTAQPQPTATPVFRAKEVLNKMYSAYYPDQTKQAIGIRVGAFLKAFGFKENQELSSDHLSMLEKFIESEHQDYMATQKKAVMKAAEASRLKEKGLDPMEVKAEAQRLYSEHSASTGISDYEKAIQAEGGLAMDPKMKEEHLRNVPSNLRGQTMPDDMAQRLFDQHLQPDASASTMYRMLSERKTTIRPRSAMSFMDEAERNLENERSKDAGFFHEAQTFSLGEQSAPEVQPVQGAGQQDVIPGTARQFGEQAPKPLFDIKQKSTFDLLKDVNEGYGEKGGIGGNKEIDPVKQAAMEAAMRELVDRAMALGHTTSQDILLYAARNAPSELQAALRKNLAPTLSAFDTNPYKDMDQAKKGNPIAKKDMMDTAKRNYFQQKADIIKGTYRKFKANQQVVLFKDMDEGLMRLKNDLFIHDNYRNFSKDELAAQRWYTEGKAPKLESLKALGVKEEDAQRWLALAKNPSENMKAARPMTQIFEDEYHDVLSEFYDKVGYVEDHVTRRWKRSREYLDWEGKTLGNRPNFTKGRKFLTQADGIDAGFEPVSFDIRDDLRSSNNARVNVLSRIHAYQKLGASFGENGLPAIIDESEDLNTQAKNAKITPHKGTAPASWMRFDHVPLLKGLAIDPYFKPAIKFMMSRPFQGTVPEVLDFLSASTKATKLYGLFHGYTLGEMTMSGISYRDVFSFGKDRNPLFKGLRYLVKGMTADMEGRPVSKNPAKAVGELYHSFMTGSGVLANRPLALDMSEHGFKFGSADEDMHGILRKFLNKTEDYLKKRIGEGAAKGITALPRTALDIQEKALWSYIRPISSMLVYETNLKDSILKFNLEAAEGKKIPIPDIKTMIANQTSKEMGGISYARLMINPRTQQVLQWAMLAPGWTIGRALMAASVFEKGPEGRQARKQMAKLFVGWFFASNMINYAQTKKYLGKARFMWDNPEGFKDQPFLTKDKDGTKYLQLSKSLTEIYDDIDHPMRTAAYKLSAPLQAGVKVMNWATARAYYPGMAPENPLVSLLHAYEPMITSGQSAYGGLPVHRGPSKNKIEGVLDEYYKGGMKDQALFQEAMQMATEQGYDISKLDRAVRGAERSKEKAALFK
jgi:hypothetical protein